MRQDVVDVLKTSRMDLVRSLIGLSPYAIHRWRIAIQQILAILAFKDAGKRRKERREDNWTTSAPVSKALVSYILGVLNDTISVIEFLMFYWTNSYL